MTDIDPYIYRGDGSIKRRKTREEIDAEREEQRRKEYLKKKYESEDTEESEQSE